MRSLPLRRDADRALAFLACSHEHAPALVERLRAARPNAQWEVVALSEPSLSLPGNMRRVRARGTVLHAMALALRAMIRRYDIVCVAADDVVRLDALASLVTFVGLLPVRTRLVLDRFGQTKTIDDARASDVLAAALTPLLLRCHARSASRSRFRSYPIFRIRSCIAKRSRSHETIPTGT
jgi:hypothetical protein